MTARLIRIYTLGTVLLGMQYEIVDGFTGMGVVKIALPLSVFRKVIFFACIFILPRFLPIEQIFFCEPISDILPPLVSILVYALTIKRVINRGPQKADRLTSVNLFRKDCFKWHFVPYRMTPCL